MTEAEILIQVTLDYYAGPYLDYRNQFFKDRTRRVTPLRYAAAHIGRWTLAMSVEDIAKTLQRSPSSVANYLSMASHRLKTGDHNFKEMVEGIRKDVRRLKP